MLLFIALANVSWYLWGREGTGTLVHSGEGSLGDTLASAVAIVTIDGRIYPMFAFLFGYGMVQFYESRARAGAPDPTVRRSLFRRHWGLLLFGFLHAALLFVGDILGAYALVGLIVMALIFRRSNQTLVIWLVSLAGLALSSLIMGSVFLALMFWVEAANGTVADTSITGPAPSLAFIIDAGAGEENYWLAALWRVGLWAINLLLQVAMSMLVPLCVIAGVLAARFGVLSQVGRYRGLLVKVALGGIALAWLSGLPTALAYLGVIPGGDNAVMLLQTASTPLGVAGGFGYVAALALAADTLARVVPWLVRALTSVGRRSLSCYILQSVVLAPLLSAWGLGLGGQIGTLAAFGIAAATWAASLLLAVLWDARGWRGPLEVALRRLSDGPRTPPARRAQPSSRV